MTLQRAILLLFVLVSLGTAHASVLPEDRSDALYHRYEGGGVLIDGPSVLVRKQVGKNVSMVGNYYVDRRRTDVVDVVVGGQ